MARIKNMGTATMKFSEGAIVTGNTAHGNGYSSDYALVVTGSQFIDAEGGGGLTIFKKEPDTAFLRFINDDDPSSWYASFAFDQAENIYLSPGRSQDFFLKTRTNVGSDPQKFPFRIYDDGKAKFEHGQSDTSAAAAALPSDVVFFVSGSKGADAKAVFGGDVVISGSLTTKQRHVQSIKYNSGDSSQQYVRFDAAGSNATPGVNNKFLAPTGGHLLYLVIRCTTTAGVTDVSFHKASDGTSTINTVATETINVDIDAAHTAFQVEFTDVSIFDAGDILGISVNPSNAPNDVNITCVWEFDFTE